MPTVSRLSDQVTQVWGRIAARALAGLRWLGSRAWSRLRRAARAKWFWGPVTTRALRLKFAAAAAVYLTYGFVLAVLPFGWDPDRLRSITPLVIAVPAAWLAYQVQMRFAHMRAWSAWEREARGLMGDVRAAVRGSRRGADESLRLESLSDKALSMTGSGLEVLGRDERAIDSLFALADAVDRLGRYEGAVPPYRGLSPEITAIDESRSARQTVYEEQKEALRKDLLEALEKFRGDVLALPLA